MPTWRIHLRDGATFDVEADWLSVHPAGLTFETVVVIVNNPRWVVVRRLLRDEIQRVERLSHAEQDETPGA